MFRFSMFVLSTAILAVGTAFTMQRWQRGERIERDDACFIRAFKEKGMGTRLWSISLIALRFSWIHIDDLFMRIGLMFFSPNV